MGDAASELNMTVQYCLPEPRHIIASTAIPAVTHARASEDYQVGTGNSYIMLPSLLYSAVGIQPFKDVFWSTVDQPGAWIRIQRHPHDLRRMTTEWPRCDRGGRSSPSVAQRNGCSVASLVANCLSLPSLSHRSTITANPMCCPCIPIRAGAGWPYSPQLHEPDTDLQLIISTLSTGPVAPGDGIPYANARYVPSCGCVDTCEIAVALVSFSRHFDASPSLPFALIRNSSRTSLCKPIKHIHACPAA